MTDPHTPATIISDPSGAAGHSLQARPAPVAGVGAPSLGDSRAEPVQNPNLTPLVSSADSLALAPTPSLSGHLPVLAPPAGEGAGEGGDITRAEPVQNPAPRPNSLLLAPPAPSYRAASGRKPHHRYRLIRTRFEDIIRARDEFQLSNRQAAFSLGFRSAKEFVAAYDMLKRHGEAICLRNDWRGVEEEIYSPKFPHYLSHPTFLTLLDEFGDPRPRHKLVAPLTPVLTIPAVAPKPRSPNPTPATPSPLPLPEPGELDAPAVLVVPPPVIPKKRWGVRAGPTTSEVGPAAPR